MREPWLHVRTTQGASEKGAAPAPPPCPLLLNCFLGEGLSHRRFRSPSGESHLQACPKTIAPGQVRSLNRPRSWESETGAERQEERRRASEKAAREKKTESAHGWVGAAEGGALSGRVGRVGLLGEGDKD